MRLVHLGQPNALMHCDEPDAIFPVDLELSGGIFCATLRDFSLNERLVRLAPVFNGVAFADAVHKLDVLLGCLCGQPIRHRQQQDLPRHRALGDPGSSRLGR